MKLAVRAQYTSAAGMDEVVFENQVNNWLTKLLPGKRYVINLTLNITGIIVDFEIVPWDKYEMDIPSFD